MKKALLFWIIMGFAGINFSPASLADHMDMPMYKGSEQFEQLKALAGTWVGTHKMGDQEERATAEYSVTSNGSAVIEKLFAGTPEEMLTVYTEKNGKPYMTHYCMLGNQPQMAVSTSDAKNISFVLVPDSDFDAAKDTHMHGLKISWIDPNHITQDWQLYENGQQTSETTIDLKRVN